MKAKFLFIVALVVLTLPCMEVTDWAGITADPSNDCAVSIGAMQASQTVPMARSVMTLKACRRTLGIAAKSASTAILTHGAYFSPGLIGIQRK